MYLKWGRLPIHYMQLCDRIGGAFRQIPPRVVVLPVAADYSGEWWLDVGAIEGDPQLYEDIPTHVKSMSDLPIIVRQKIAVLMHADNSRIIKGVGRKIGKRSYLVYIPDRHYKP